MVMGVKPPVDMPHPSVNRMGGVMDRRRIRGKRGQRKSGRAERDRRNAKRTKGHDDLHCVLGACWRSAPHERGFSRLM
jgi:hypothetical protein